MHIAKLISRRFPNQQHKILIGLFILSGSALMVGLGALLLFG